MNNHIRKSIHTIDEVLNIVKDIDYNNLNAGQIKKEKERIIFNDVSVRLCSNRYRVFKNKGVTCKKCGLIGKFFALEKCKMTENEVFHFNLYGVKDNEEVLFTKDHIIPKSKGGKNVFENYQTMCNPCNNKKGNKYE